MTEYVLSVNNERRTVSADPAFPLLWVLREQHGLAGTRFAWGDGLCGACTVQVDGAALQVPQCGYCQPGMLRAATAFLAKNPNPDADAVRAGITNLCRCGTDHRVERAVPAAAEEVAGLRDSS